LPVDPYRDLRWGLPVLRLVSYAYMPSPYPGRFDEACSLVPIDRLRPSLCNNQVGSCNCFFGACLAFTHVMACTLAESLNDPFHRKLRQLRCLRCRFDCYRVERTSSRAGLAPAEVQRLSRRTFSPTIEFWHPLPGCAVFVSGGEATKLNITLGRRPALSACEKRISSISHG